MLHQQQYSSWGITHQSSIDNLLQTDSTERQVLIMTHNKKTLRSQLTKVMDQAMTVPGHARPEKKEKLNAGAIPRDVWGDLMRPAMLMR